MLTNHDAEPTQKLKKRRHTLPQIVATMIAYTEKQKGRGTTFWELWSWYEKTFRCGMSARGTVTGRWREMIDAGILLPTHMRRSQQDAADVNPEYDSEYELSRRTSQVFVLREGATIADWIARDRTQSRSDDAIILSAWHKIRGRWPEAGEKQREKLLLEVIGTMVEELHKRDANTARLDSNAASLQSAK
jgi:hypothetical protein